MAERACSATSRSRRASQSAAGKATFAKSLVNGRVRFGPTECSSARTARTRRSRLLASGVTFYAWSLRRGEAVKSCGLECDRSHGGEQSAERQLASRRHRATPTPSLEVVVARKILPGIEAIIVALAADSTVFAFEEHREVSTHLPPGWNAADRDGQGCDPLGLDGNRVASRHRRTHA